MKTVQDIAGEIVAREGGFVNDPDDPGGPTNFGVTLGVMRALGMDLDRDGDVDIEDVRRLTREQAVLIFIRDYFEKPRLNLLPEALQPTVFDMAVNAGASRAVKLLQEALRFYVSGLVIDGVMGPQTAAAAREALQIAPDFVDTYGIRRRNFYYSLADARPASRKFARRNDGGKGGWITRAEEFISPAKHLTESQHRARVMLWT